MLPPTRLDRALMERAFGIMGEYLRDRKALGEIVIYGGSAIMFQFDWRGSSHDVDAIVQGSASHGLVMQAAAEAADRLKLPASWLSDRVAMYARPGESEADRVPVGMYPSFERPGLRVLAARPEYVLAMKLSALERATTDDRDYSDAVSIGAELGIDTVDGLVAVFESFFPQEQLPHAARLRLRRLAEAIRLRMRTEG